MFSNFTQLLRARRTQRQYTKATVSNQQKKLLEEALLRSPTSRNNRPWTFWFIEDLATLNKLSKSKKAGSAMIKDCALAVVVGADSTKSDVWIEDCAIASTLLQLQAQDLGLGSCWVQIRLRESSQESVSSEDFVKGVLKIEESSTKIAAIISIGEPVKERAPLPYDQLLFTSLHKGSEVSKEQIPTNNLR